MKKQPAPKKNKRLPINDLVIKDLKDRKKQGAAKYGTVLQPFNDREAIVDLYEELLDACQYCRQLIEELKEFDKWRTKHAKR